MARALRTAIVGWSLGFAIAALYSGTRAHNPHLTASLIPWAVGGLAVMAVLLALVGLRDALTRRRLTCEEREDEEWFARMHAPVVPPAPTITATAAQIDAPTATAESVEARIAAAAAEAAEARIALLEARLALEQEQLDAAVSALAEEQALVAPPGPNSADEAQHRNDATTAEPLLREELVEALAELVGRRVRGADLTDEFESVLKRAG